MTFFIKSERTGNWEPWLAAVPVCSNSNQLEGVYRPEPLEKVQRDLQPRIARFLQANAIGSMLEKQQYFRGDHYIEPLFGAFGEKL